MNERANAAGGRGRGRPVKDRAQTHQARALAFWLRERVTKGMTNRQLAERVGVYGHAMWAEFRNGTDVIPMHVLERLLHKVVPERRLREQLLAEGRELVERAEQAAAGKLAASTRGLSERDLLHRLQQAQDAQIEAQQQLLGTNNLVALLLNVLHNTRQHNQTLQAETAHQRKQAARLRLELTRRRLRDVRAARDEAEDLHLESYAQVEQYRRLLGEHRTALELPATLATPDLQQLSEQECDRLLDETAGVLLQVWRTLDEIRERLGLPAADDRKAPAIVHGQVVDSPDDDPDLQIGAQPPGQAHEEQASQRPEPRPGITAPGDPTATAVPPVPPARGRRRASMVGVVVLVLAVAGGMTWYTTRDSTRTPEPVAAWLLDESREAKIAKDTAGSYNGNATAVRWGDGSDGSALFDGRSSRVATAGPVLKTGQGHSYTVSAWAWLDTPDTASEFATVVSQSAGDLTAFFLQYWATPNRWAFSGPKDRFRVQSSVEAVPHRWTHLVGVCDRGTLTLYVDGKQVGADNSVNVAVPESETDQLIIGGAGLARVYGDTYKDFFPGSIKNVQVFDQALTLDEINALG